MRIWLGTHEIESTQYAVAMRGVERKLVARRSDVKRYVLDGLAPLSRVETRVRKHGRGGVVAAALSTQAQLMLRVEPGDGQRTDALLTVHGLRSPERVLRAAEAVLLRLQPTEVDLIGFPQGGASGPQPYMPEGALFVRMLHSTRSELQRIQVGEHPVYGRMLFLNGETQIADSDEPLYSRSLVEPAMREGVRRVCILGGGDCGVLRQVLTHGDVEQAVMCEIDGAVVETASEFFPAVVGDARTDPRARIVLGDAFAFIREQRGFDLVVYDLSDEPLGGSMAEVCESIHAALAPGGRIALQCGSALPMYGDRLKKTLKAIGKVFANVERRDVVIPSFLDQPWVFVFGRRRD